jgi:hypothetical protein
MDRLHEWPTLVGIAVVVALFLVPTLIGSAFLQPVIGRLLRGEKDPNAPVALLLNVFTLYYAVLLALLSLAVFENYNKAQDTIAREAASIVMLYRNLSGYPEPIRSSLVDVLQRYLDEETGPGWRDQRENRISPPGLLLVDELNRQLLSFRPNRDASEDILHRETLRTFSEFVDRRRARMEAGGTNIPPIIWYVVLTGAILNVVVLWLFDLGRTTHLVLGGVLTLFIGLVIYMVAVLDQPFRGVHGLTPDDLISARQEIMKRGRRSTGSLRRFPSTRGWAQRRSVLHCSKPA